MFLKIPSSGLKLQLKIKQKYFKQ